MTIYKVWGIFDKIVHLLKNSKEETKWNEFWNQGYKSVNLLSNKGDGF